MKKCRVRSQECWGVLREFMHSRCFLWPNPNDLRVLRFPLEEKIPYSPSVLLRFISVQRSNLSSADLFKLVTPGDAQLFIHILMGLGGAWALEKPWKSSFRSRHLFESSKSASDEWTLYQGKFVAMKTSFSVTKYDFWLLVSKNVFEQKKQVYHHSAAEST